MPSQQRRQPLGLSETTTNSQKIHASFLQKASNKKDLVKRLQAVVQVLETDASLHGASPDWPGLDGLAQVLVTYLQHADKKVRLLTVQACMELFSIYAPESPWDHAEILAIFRQTLVQLANLAHTTGRSENQSNNSYYHTYLRILTLLAEVKIGVVLVELDKHLRLARDNDDDSDSEDDQVEAHEPLEVLTELVRTLLQSVRAEHDRVVLTLVQQAIAGCLDEYHVGMPVELLDELLLVIGQGPTVLVTNPAAVQAQAELHQKNKKKGSSDKSAADMPPLQVKQPHAPFHVAAAVVQATLNKTATPIASLLNGLLNNDTRIVETSQIAADLGYYRPGSSKKNKSKDKPCTDVITVWTIVYQLAQVAPDILVTVIGTVSNGLHSDEVELRLQACQLLGDLFCLPDLPVQYPACFREWLGCQDDVDPAVRRALCKLLAALLTKSFSSSDASVVSQASNALQNLLSSDPVLDVRLQGITSVAELSYRYNRASAPLVQALGDRVSAKNKRERKDALSALARIYHRQYLVPQGKEVQAGGDDCDLAVILQTLHGTCHLDSGSGGRSNNRRSHNSLAFEDDDDEESRADLEKAKFAWIPRKVLEGLFYTDQADTEMRSRVVLCVDEVLVGASSSTGKSKLSQTSRAVALAMILNSLRQGDENLLTTDGYSSNAFKFLKAFMLQRARLQQAVSSYIDARAKTRECESGSEEAFAADSKAKSILQSVAALSAPVTGTQPTTAEVLQSFHGARDKRIFQILATISSPSHSMSARARALDELPKRTKPLGDAVSDWVEGLVRRCAMGHLLNAEVVDTCMLLAQEAFVEDDIPACGAFLTCIKFASQVFPGLCGTKKAFETLTELFSQCRHETSRRKKAEIEESGIITTLSSALSAAAPAARAQGLSLDNEQHDTVVDEDLQAQLLQLCTRDGTPEQARNSVYTLARLVSPEQDESLSSPKASQDNEGFAPLLKALTSPTRLSISSQSEKESTKLVSVLTALSAFTDCAPSFFGSSARGNRAIKFALETVLMGHNGPDDDEEDVAFGEDLLDDESVSGSARKKKHGSGSKKRQGPHHQSHEASGSLLEDESLSIPCRRICAAIDFLVSCARSKVLESKRASSGDRQPSECPSTQQIRQVFQLLSQILREKGLPPSNRDRKVCKSRQDRAALRQCAAVHLLRLCDSRLGYEKVHLTNGMWHTLADVFLDEEYSVRNTAMEELSDMFQGKGAYGLGVSRVAPAVPSLRFLAFVVLCTDGDHGADHHRENGHAAVVGKLAVTTKKAANACVVNLRNACEGLLMQARVQGKNAERQFESSFKMLLMPEYTVPFAFHLLALRDETPSAGGTPIGARTVSADDEVEKSDEEVDDVTMDDASQQRVLRRRLKWLFEPLVQSLGDGADNIGFLLRIAELLGKNFRPVDVDRGPTAAVSSHPVVNVSDERNELLESKLKTICVAATEVLRSFVKKDVNLSAYPGQITIPAFLFHKSNGSVGRLSLQSIDSAGSNKRAPVSSNEKSPGPRSALAMHSRKSKDSADSDGRVHVHFSPELVAPPVRQQQSVQSAASTKNEDFDGLSPVAKSETPITGKRSTPRSRGALASAKSATSSGSAATLGTTPPSILRNATIRSTAPEEGDTDELVLDVPSSTESLKIGASPRSDSKSSSIVRLSGSSNDDGQLADDEGGDHKASSETQSTLDTGGKASLPSPTNARRKRKPSAADPSKAAKKAKKTKKAGSIPIQIHINRSKPDESEAGKKKGKSKKRRSSGSPVDELDFDFDFSQETAAENEPERRNRTKKEPKQNQPSKKRRGGGAAAETKSSRSSRALRIRRG